MGDSGRHVCDASNLIDIVNREILPVASELEYRFAMMRQLQPLLQGMIIAMHKVVDVRGMSGGGPEMDAIKEYRNNLKLKEFEPLFHSSNQKRLDICINLNEMYHSADFAEHMEGLLAKILQLEPTSENAIKTIQKIVDVRGMTR